MPETAPEQTAAAAAASTHAVALKLPCFWPRQASVWFLQAEAQFRNRSITEDQTKYDHVVMALDQDSARLVADLLTKPPDSEKYEHLKARLLEDVKPTRRQRASCLIHMNALGDRRPSELMADMLELMGDEKPGLLFEQLFIEQLPTDVQLVLSSGTFKDTRELARAADALCGTRRSSPGIYQTKDAVEAAQFEAATSRPSDPDVQAVARKQHPRRASPTFQGDVDLCFFHRRFGAAARKCRPPCRFSGNDKAGRK